MKKYDLLGTVLLLLEVAWLYVLLIVNNWVGKGDVLGVGGMFLHSWVAWLLLPLPIAVGVLSLAFIKKRKSASLFKVTGVVALIVAGVMLFYGSFFIKYRNDYVIDYEVMKEVSQTTGVTFPEKGEACKAFLEDGYEIEGAFAEGEELEAFVLLMKHDDRFTKKLSPGLLHLVPNVIAFDMHDYFLVYDLSAGEAVKDASAMAEGKDVIVFGYNEEKHTFLVRAFQVGIEEK